MKKILNFINGEFVEPQRGVFLDGINPAADKVIYQLANSDASDVAQAVNAAHIAYRDWQQTTVETRVNYLNQFANLILEHAEELAQLESQDTGKPLSLAAQIDIPRSAKNFHYFAQAVSQFQEQAYHTDEHSLNYTLHQSLGVVACISPWNLPLYLLTWKIAPALAMGNCIVAKPSELTPLTANKLAELSIQAGLPAGVLNIIHGEGHGAGQALCENEQVAAVSFTGGTKTGRQLAKTVAPQFKKLSLELGGKNAAIIFNDCDFDKMLETVVRSCFANQGEICLCSSRVLVERALYDRFLDEFIPRVKQLKIGDPNEPNTKIGALISKSHQQKVLSYIDLARSEGGQVLCGGQAWGEGGVMLNPQSLLA